MSAPNYLPEWAIEDTTLPATGQANKKRPKESLRNIGWDKGQIPSAEEFNWLFNNMYLWVKYITDEALPTYLPITGTQISFTGNITGTATWDGDKAISVDLASDLDSSTSSAIANTLAKRDSSGGINFKYLTAAGITDTSGITSPSVTVNGNLKSTGTSTLSTVDINGGNIDGTTIGASTPSPATVSTLTANNAVTLTGGVTSTGTNTFSGINTFSNKLNLQSSNVASNGYTYLPNGVIMQWGWVASSDDSYISVTLPLTFPNACFNVQATANYNTSITNDGTLSAHAYIDSTSTIHVAVSSPTSDVPNILGVYWTAIGY